MKCKRCGHKTAMRHISRQPDADGLHRARCEGQYGGCGAVIKYNPTDKEKVPHMAKPVIPAPVVEPQVTVTMDELPSGFDDGDET